MSEVEELPSKQVQDFLQNHPDSVLVDVRTQEEWDTIGKPDGDSISMTTYFISYQKGLDRILNENFEQDFLNLNIEKSKKILFLCRSGIRSLKAAMIIEKCGYKTLNISDGFEGSTVINEPGWKANKLPCKGK